MACEGERVSGRSVPTEKLNCIMFYVFMTETNKQISPAIHSDVFLMLFWIHGTVTVAMICLCGLRHNVWRQWVNFEFIRTEYFVDTSSEWSFSLCVSYPENTSDTTKKSLMLTYFCRQNVRMKNDAHYFSAIKNI